MTHHPRLFPLLAFLASLAALLVGFGLLLQDSVAATVLGFLLVDAVTVFALVYFVVLPGRRREAVPHYEFLMSEPPAWWFWNGECWTYIGLHRPEVSANGSTVSEKNGIVVKDYKVNPSEQE